MAVNGNQPGLRETVSGSLSGGAVPELNQISLEEDLENWVPLGDRVVLRLFGGGGEPGCANHDGNPGISCGQSWACFSPRGGRDSTCVSVREGVWTATRERVLRELETLVQDGTGVPSLYVATHGKRGNAPR